MFLRVYRNWKKWFFYRWTLFISDAKTSTYTRFKYFSYWCQIFWKWYLFLNIYKSAHACNACRGCSSHHKQNFRKLTWLCNVPSSSWVQGQISRPLDDLRLSFRYPNRSDLWFTHSLLWSEGGRQNRAYNPLTHTLCWIYGPLTNHKAVWFFWTL